MKVYLSEAVNALSSGVGIIQLNVGMYPSSPLEFLTFKHNVTVTWLSSMLTDNENIYSPNKHGGKINNTNTIKTTQLQSRQKHLKLDSNLDTRLTHNTLGKAKLKYS